MFRVKDKLTPLSLLGVLLIIILLFPFDALRIILGLPLIFFFPSYTLVAAMFTREKKLDGIK